MYKTISLIVAVTALTVGPALAEKLTKVDGKNIELGGKKYEVSSSRTKLTIAGKPGTRDALKVGMDCKATASGADLTGLDCK